MNARTRDDRALGVLCEAMGIHSRWRDVTGAEQVADRDTQRALLAAMGVEAANEAEIRESLEELRARRAARRIPQEVVVTADTAARIPLKRAAEWRVTLESGGMLEGRRKREIVLTLPPGLHRLTVGEDTCLVIAAPERAPAIGDADDLGKAWGVSAALYGLHSRSNVGIGDYRDLAIAAEHMARLGADFLGINPVHARGTVISPYSPTCRTALEPGHIAPDDVPGFGCSAEARRLLEERTASLDIEKAGGLLDYEAHGRRLREILEALFRATVEAQQSTADDFALWRRGAGRALEWFAVFEAIAGVHGPDWRRWPEALQAAGSPDVQRFASENERSVSFHAWLQWLAGRQLGEAQAAARAAGMAFGLYLDLAVGTRPGGADTWAEPACFARGVSLGAPPDTFNSDGQMWNLAPFSPPELRAAAYRPFVQMLRAAMGHAGIVRLDHVLGLDRCFWIPESGASGGYVRYPLKSLLALVRLEATRSGCIVVGEDLGCISPGLRRQLYGAGLLGCAVMQFDADGHGLHPPGTYRRDSLASFGTHDTPTFKGWWRGRDIELGRELGRTTTAKESTASFRRRAAHRRALCRLLVEEGHAPPGLDLAAPPREADDAMVVAVHALLAGSGSALLSVRLDDALGLVEQQNLPGTVDEYPNWRRRYPVAIESLADDFGLAAVAGAVSSGREGVRDRSGSPCGTVAESLKARAMIAMSPAGVPRHHSRRSLAGPGSERSTGDTCADSVSRTVSNRVEQ